MAKGKFIDGQSTAIWDETEYRDQLELLFVFYVNHHRDMCGVVPVYEPIVASKCRTSVRKLRKVIDYFESIKKLKVAKDRSHIWWRSGIYYSLYKGHSSKQQQKSVVVLLNKWSSTGLFGRNFLLEVVQLYATKYSLVIPYADYLNLTELNLAEVEVEKRNNIIIDPNKVIHKKTHTYDVSKTPYENLMIWNESQECDDMIVEFSATPGYELDWVRHEFFETFVPWVKIESDKAKESLFNKYEGSWKSMFFAWLRRAKRSGDYDKYYQKKASV